MQPPGNAPPPAGGGYGGPPPAGGAYGAPPPAGGGYGAPQGGPPGGLQNQGPGGDMQPTSDEKNLAMLCHISAWFFPFVVPLVIYFWKKDESKYVAFHALQAVVGYGLCIVTGYCLFFIPYIFGVIACLKINGGEGYEYPIIGGWCRKTVYGS